MEVERRTPVGNSFSMESRMRWKSHVRFGSGENQKIASNDYLSAYTVSIKPVFTKEANAECEQRIRSNAYVLNVEGKLMREASKDFLLCAYEMSHVQDGKDDFLKDINSKTPKFTL